MKNVVQDSKMLSDVIEELDNTLDKMDKNFRQQDVAKAAKETHTVNVPTEQKTKVIEVATKYTERKKLSSAQKAPIESLKKSLSC